MPGDDERSSTALDSDIYAERDVWAIRDSYNTYVNPGQTSDQILAALANNRDQFEALREQFARAVNEDGGITKSASRKRKVYFKELNRLYSATEAIKDELRRRGVRFDIDISDEEHPNSAYRRYVKKWENEKRAKRKCYVVTAIYGEHSRELTRARTVCRARFALNPWILPSWILYKIFGKYLARVASYHPRVYSLVYLFLAKPIVMASHRRLSTALPWIFYLGLFGWCCIATAVAVIAR